MGPYIYHTVDERFPQAGPFRPPLLSEMTQPQVVTAERVDCSVLTGPVGFLPNVGLGEASEHQPLTGQESALKEKRADMRLDPSSSCAQQEYGRREGR